MSITWECAWSLVELVGSFLINPYHIAFTSFEKPNMEVETKNFEKNIETEEIVFKKKNRNSFYVFLPS